MQQPRYLTKSRYKLAMECPTKLFYTNKKKTYADQKVEDTFLEALAEGGFQVGALAQLYFPGGHEIATQDYVQAVQETNELLKQDTVTIYEAAFQVDDFFIRTDILRKHDGHIELIEVKAKSYDPTDEEDNFVGKRGGLNSGWKPYLYDIAFQKYVVRKALPQYPVTAYLMLADKSAKCPTDGLNQKFKIEHSQNGRIKITVSEKLTKEDIAKRILCQIPVDEYCAMIYDEKVSGMTYPQYLAFLANHYKRDEKIITPISTVCKKCEFYTEPEDDQNGLQSGYKECWKKQLGWKDNDFDEPTVLNIWAFRKAGKLLESGTIKMSDLREDDIGIKTDDDPGISPSERQWLQVQKVQNKDTSIWIDKENLQREMASWKFPLHFIDFETTMVAIPFNKGRRPYEGVAFQFSHHTVDAHGRVEHKGEYLNVQRGIFPNYEFLRALKKELEQDDGSIFRYSNHENTFLNHIYKQLLEDETDIPDREELITFIKTITHATGSSVEKWQGPRDMIDLWVLVKRYYYDPHTNGSNSIKDVLPAILNSSKYLQEKYGKPIYGAADGIQSHNFKDWQWLKLEEGKVLNPYKLLPLLFQDADKVDEELFSGENNKLCDGGAALTAYAKLQFEEMSDYERRNIHTGLLRYCELDTLAMVMIYEAWREMIKE
jgi:hypothetical protein